MPEQASTTVRSIFEKVLEADVKDQITQRGRELAAAVGDATDVVSARATEAWRESAPQRRDAEKSVRKASRKAAGWGRRRWQRDVRPSLRQLWNRRTVAMGAAGAAIPAGRELVEDAAVRLGIRKRREERHWAAFFLGMLIGLAAGAIVAMLTTPKPGREMRDELAVKAREAAEKAREAAGNVEWAPLFQREGANGEGDTFSDATPETPIDANAAEGDEKV
ncbi:MAG TPA: YtxH domain-containing protein [Candidatus Dormibacteraeota bacterium]|nr:YtxH domain-containing protein [Candidatus Dormibacteraeota bacterium]